MLANSLADVVAEEAAKRLLPELNLERKAKKAERVGVGWQDVWRWCKRTFGQNEVKLCTRAVLSTLVDDLAHQGHLLVRHNKGLRCKVCNVYRADRQFRFWSRHPCVPRPRAAVVISQFRNKKRQHINTSAGNSCPVPGQSGERSKTSSKHDEKEAYHGTSLGGQDIQCTHSHPDHLPLPVSLEPEDDLAHTHQCCDYSISQDAEQSGESQHVLTKLHVCGMEGKRRKIASSVDPELHYGQISMTQKDGTPPVPRRNAYNGTWYIAWLLSMVGQSSRVVILVVLGLVRSLWWNMGTKLGRSQLHVGPVGRFSRARTLLESRVEAPLLPGLKSQVWRLGAKRCVNSLGVCGNSIAGRYGPLCAQPAGGAVDAGAALRLLKSQCDGSGESRQKARRKQERDLMPKERVVADAKRAF